MTHNRDENVVGWHQHDLAGGTVEALAVLPQKDQLQDALWCVVRRIVNGQPIRYIERLTRFWDFFDTTTDKRRTSWTRANATRAQRSARFTATVT